MKTWAWLAVSLVVMGCEAPLNLSGVDQERERLLHRYDQFQGAADNGSVLVVVGAGGTVLTSTNKGRGWERQQLDGSPSLIGVAACPDGTFGALDPLHGLWVSTDGAASWLPQKIESPEVPLALTCDPQNRFWVVGGFSTIWMSADHGENWQEHSLGEDAQLTSVQFVAPDTGSSLGSSAPCSLPVMQDSTGNEQLICRTSSIPRPACFWTGTRGGSSALTAGRFIPLIQAIAG